MVAKKTIAWLLEYIVVFWVVIEYHTVYTHLVNNNHMLLSGIALLFMLIISTLRLDLLKTISPIFLVYLGGACLLLLAQTAKLGYAACYIVLISEFYLCFTVCELTDGNLTLLHKFAKVMTFVGGTSVLLWILVSNLGVLRMTGFLPNTWTPNVYYVPTFHGIYCETQRVVLFGREFVRNTSFFNEGPVFCMCLCAALCIEVFLTAKRSSLRIVILVISILSSQTTTGQIFLCLLVSLIIVLGWGKESKIMKVLTAPILLALLFGICIALISIFGEKQESNSLYLRTSSVVEYFNKALEKPLIGSGFGAEVGSFGISNSIAVLFYQLGVVGLGLYIYCIIWVPFRYFVVKIDRSWFLYALLYFCIFSVTVSYFKALNIMMLALGLAFSGSCRRLER